MSKKVTFVRARPSGEQKNLFAFYLHKKFSKNGKGVCVQMSEMCGLEKERVVRAFHGKSILISEAHALAKALGFNQKQLFLKKREPSKKQRNRPKMMLQS